MGVAIRESQKSSKGGYAVVDCQRPEYSVAAEKHLKVPCGEGGRAREFGDASKLAVWFDRRFTRG